MMRFKAKKEMDISAYLVVAIALLCGWFCIIDWIVALLFCLCVSTFKIKFEEK